MEVDPEVISNNTTNPGRVLRKRKKLSYVDRVVKRRTNNIRVNRSKKETRRHRSLDPPKIDTLSTESHVPRPSTSIGSLGSVVYLGYYRKVPQLITLDENNDSIENQGEDPGQNLFTEGQNVTPSSYCPKNDVEQRTLDQVPDNSWNEMRDTNNLMNLIREMCVGATYKRIVTRARARESKKLM